MLERMIENPSGYEGFDHDDIEVMAFLELTTIRQRFCNSGQ